MLCLSIEICKIVIFGHSGVTNCWCSNETLKCVFHYFEHPGAGKTTLVGALLKRCDIFHYFEHPGAGKTTLVGVLLKCCDIFHYFEHPGVGKTTLVGALLKH